MLAELGEQIVSNLDQARLICIAGPSSSGKTTFSNRLRLELMSRGVKPIKISIDDFYLPKNQIPLDENGEPDLECLQALDVPLFNQTMLSLIEGEEVQLPKFDFKLGKQVPGEIIQIANDQPIIIEGIHALSQNAHAGAQRAIGGADFSVFRIFIILHKTADQPCRHFSFLHCAPKDAELFSL